jgi:hypothetical protein
MLTCQICQHENPEGAEYCENCGAALESSSPMTSNEPQAMDIPVTPDMDDASMSEADTSLGTAPLTPDSLPDELDDAPAADGDVSSDVLDVAAGEASLAPTPSGDQRPRLTPIRHGAPAGEAYPLMGDRLLVGRFDAETGPVDIDLSEVPEAEQISRNHAEIYREADGTWYVQDLGSTNGVFVKSSGSLRFGPRLTAPQALQSGDELSFGNSRFLFQIG